MGIVECSNYCVYSVTFCFCINDICRFDEQFLFSFMCECVCLYRLFGNSGLWQSVSSEAKSFVKGKAHDS